MNNYIQAKQEDIASAIEHFKKDLATLRTGRANPVIFDGVSVEAYGVHTPLNGLANVAVADSRSMTITPWDKSVGKDIEKALVAANLGVGIINEGDKIRITIPAMTEENRKDLVKKCNEKMEKAKIALRQIRDEIKTEIEAGKEAHDINEDIMFRYLKELDEEISSRNEEVKELRDKKEAEIMEI
ncbi:MAG: ribosome recycling factor [Candidatus Falkowbacteria bacterium]